MSNHSDSSYVPPVNNDNQHEHPPTNGDEATPVINHEQVHMADDMIVSPMPETTTTPQLGSPLQVMWESQ